jgi:large subunit ribosomal protein L23
MHPTQVVKRPLVTEKCTWEAGAHNRYSFEVNMKADKGQIRRAIVGLYKVRIEAVATQVRKGKYRRTRFGTAKTKDWKKATVQLHPDDRIELF